MKAPAVPNGYLYGHIAGSIAYMVSAFVIMNWVGTIYILCQKYNFNHDYIDGLKVRDTKAIIFGGILLVVSHGICIPYDMISKIFTHHWVFTLIAQVNTWIIILPPPLILLCRTFNIYFKIKYNINLEANKWKKLITKESNNLDKLSKFYHGFVQSGSVFIMYGIIAGVYMVLWCLAHIWHIQISSAILHGLLLGQSIPNVIGYIVFGIILPKYEDIYGIRKETQYLAIFWPVMMIISGMALYLTQSNTHLHYLTSTLLGLPGNIGIMYFVIYYPLYILNLPKWCWQAKPYIKHILTEKQLTPDTRDELDEWNLSNIYGIILSY